MKKLTSLLLALVLMFQLVPAAVLADGAETPVLPETGLSETIVPQADTDPTDPVDEETGGEDAATVRVLVTVANKGVFAVDKDGKQVTERSVTLTGKTSYTVDDALRTLHDDCYPGGADAGYGIGPTGAVTKLWGDDSFNFGYYKNDAYCTDGAAKVEVANGDRVYAFVYKDTSYSPSDIYTYFDQHSVSVEKGVPVTLTLFSNETYGLITNRIANAEITIDGAATSYKTSADESTKGQVTLTFDKNGTYFISAKSDVTQDWGTQIITPPLCTVKVGTGVSEGEDAEISVTLIKQGAFVTAADGEAVAMRKVTLTGKTSYTVDDALRAAHDAFYSGGAAAGYASENSQYGLSLTKLWGDTSGAFGYYRNDAMAWSLEDPVIDGDRITAYIYSDTENYSDAYSYFDKHDVTAELGKDVVLTLMYHSGWDDNYAPVFSPLAGAKITVDGKESAFVTDEAGKATLTFSAAGRHIVSAVSSELTLVPPVCVVEVEADDGITVTVSIANLKEGAFVTAKDGKALIERAVTLQNKESYTVDDALFAAHQAFYDGEVTDEVYASNYLWGVKLASFGSAKAKFGFYKNDAECDSRDDTVKNGDRIYAFIYKDTPDYVVFDKTECTVESGVPFSLTLKDETGSPVADAVITIDGTETAYQTGADGKVSVTVPKDGTYLISAVPDGITLPVCYVTAESDNRLSGLVVRFLNLSPAFSEEITEYTVPNRTYGTSSVQVQASFDDDRAATLSVNGGDAIALTSGKAQAAQLTAGENTLAVTVTPPEGSALSAKTYTVRVVRETAFSALTLTQGGASVPLSPAFAAAKTDYTAVAAVGEMTLAAAAAGDAANTVLTVNDEQTDTVTLTEGENVLTVAAASRDGKFKKEYTVTVTAYPTVQTTMRVPAGANLYLTGEDGGSVVLPEPELSEDKQTESYVLTLLKGATYSYTVGKYGFESATGTIEGIDGFEKIITLTPSASSDEPDGSAQWKNFRNSSQNNGTTDAKTPVSADTAALKWVTQESFTTGSGWQLYNPAGFVMADGLLYTTRGSSVVALDRDTGEIVKSGEIDASGVGALGAIGLTLGGGKVFVPLTDGRVQALDADTLESLWISEKLGTQCTTSLTYDSGYVYGSTGNASPAAMFCLSAADEDPKSSNETKYATWKLDTSANKGSYWSTPVVVGNYVIIGTDAVSTNSRLLSVNKQTGEIASELALTGLGHQRTSIVYQNNRVWFGTQNGTFATAAIDRMTGALSDLQTYNNGYTYATATPVLYDGTAYFSTAVSGAKILAAIDISDPADMKELRRVAFPNKTGNPQSSPLLSTAYASEGKVYLYTSQNVKPGALYVVCDDGETMTMEPLFTPEDSYQQYCIASPICDENGTIYYRNDSGYIFAVSSLVGIKLDETTLALSIGESAQLTATASVPGGDKSLIWETSAPAVASVSDGKVTALSAGSAVITVRTADGRYSATCLVVVKATTILYSENATAYVSEPTGTLPTNGVLTHTQTRTPTAKKMKEAANALSLLEELDGWVWSVEELEVSGPAGEAFTVTAPLTAGITMSKTYLNSKKYTPVAARLKGTTLTFLETEVNGDYATFPVKDLDATYVLLVLTNDSALEAMDQTEDTTDYDALIAKIKAADEGDTVRLNITSSTQIPWEVFEALEKADPNVTLNLVANKYQWKFNSDDVKLPDEAGKTFDPWVRLLEKESTAEKAFAGEKYLSVSFRGTEKVPGRSTLVFSTNGTSIAGADDYTLFGIDEDGNLRDSSGRFLADGNDCAITITSRAQFVVREKDKAAANPVQPEIPETTQPGAAGTTAGGTSGASSDLKPALTEEDIAINQEMTADPSDAASILDLSEYEDFMREAVANQQALQTALTDTEAAWSEALDSAVRRTALLSVGGTAAACVLLFALAAAAKRKKEDA